MRLRGRLRGGTPGGDETPAGPQASGDVIEVDVRALAGSFSPPTWLRDLGLLSWLVVGIGVVLVGSIWLLAQTETIVIPVILGVVIAAVAGPGVSAMQRRGIPRPAGALLVLLAVVVLMVVIVLLVVGGITSESASISSLLTQALDEVESWLKSLGISEDQVKQELEKSLPTAGKALVSGVGGSISDLASIATILVFTVFATFFLLKDGPSMRRWAEGHVGVPHGVAHLVVGKTLTALRGYFLGVTIVAAFNAVVIGLGAVILDVPLAGTIAVVTFVGAYVPFIGAWVSGIFAVAMALTTGDSTDAIAMAIIALVANGVLQQIVQPIAYGATLGLNPLVVLVVTIGGGALFGMVGLVLAAPLTSAAVNIASALAREREEEAQDGSGPPGGGPEPAGAQASA